VRGPYSHRHRTPRKSWFTDFLRVVPPVHATFTPPGRKLGAMGDFMAVLGIIVFAVVMLGLIWGLDHV
jgi:hypothetical protein